MRGFHRGPRRNRHANRVAPTSTPTPNPAPTDPWLMELYTYTSRVGQLRAIHTTTGVLCAGNRQAGRVRLHFPL